MVVFLNKCDQMADEDMLELVEMEVKVLIFSLSLMFSTGLNFDVCSNLSGKYFLLLTLCYLLKS